MKWYFLFCILVFNNSGNAQIKKIIVLEEKFKNLNKWTIESNSPDQFKLKRGSLWIDNTPSLSNKGGNRISRISIRLKTKIACNFQASAIFSFPCMSNSDTTYFLLLSNDAESPLKSIHNYMNITQDMLGLYAVGSGFKDSVDIRVINIQNKFRQIINYNNRIRIPVNKSFDITMKLWYDEQLEIEVKEQFSKYTYKALSMGLNNNPKNHIYEYLNNINIVANHFSENYKAGEKPKQTFVSLDDVVVEDKHYLECKKSAEGVQVPQVKCNIALARISGKSVTGETSLLVDGDAHCSQYDKIDLYASLDTSEYIGKTQIPHIITIVYPNGKNILVPCLKTNFIAEEVGVYTIIMSFNKEAGSCGTFSKYLYVIERPKPVLQNLVQIEAYKDINCNEIKDIKEAYVYNYTLKIKNLQTNAITTFDRNTRIILADLAEDQYELEFLVANKSGMRKRVVKVVKINNTTKLLEIKINNCEIVKEVETKLNVLYNKQLHNSPIFSK